MQLFVFSVLVIIIGISLLIGRNFEFPFRKTSGALVIVLGGFMIISSTFTSVPAKTVGVVHAFGKVSDRTLSPGLHLVAPWQKIVEIDGSLKTDTYSSENPIKAKIGDGSEAGIALTIRWNIVESNSNKIYETYKGEVPTDNLKSSVINPNLVFSVQQAVSNYNPIAKARQSNGESFSPDLAAIAKSIEASMTELLSDNPMATIDSVTVTDVFLHGNTQSKIDDYVTAVAETRVAEQRKETSKAQADSNKILSQSVSNNPNVLVSKCLDTFEKSVEAGYQLPAGFSCWSGGSSVIVPGTNAAPQSE